MVEKLKKEKKQGGGKKKYRLKVTSLSGHTFIVNTSDRACLKFGFKSGDVAIIPYGNEAIIMGVAPLFKRDQKNKGRNVLWFAAKGDRGKVSYYDDLRLGSRLKKRARPRKNK